MLSPSSHDVRSFVAGSVAGLVAGALAAGVIALSLQAARPGAMPGASLGATSVDERWSDALTRAEGAWGANWPQAIAVLEGFRADYPDHVAVKEKLYEALLAYGQALSLTDRAREGTVFLERALILMPNRGIVSTPIPLAAESVPALSAVEAGSLPEPLAAAPTASASLTRPPIFVPIGRDGALAVTPARPASASPTKEPFQEPAQAFSGPATKEPFAPPIQAFASTATKAAFQPPKAPFRPPQATATKAPFDVPPRSEAPPGRADPVFTLAQPWR